MWDGGVRGRTGCGHAVTRLRGYAVVSGRDDMTEPFHANGRVATAGGCLASHYLAAWLIWEGAGREVAVEALSYVLPHGEEDEYTHRALSRVEPFVGQAVRG